MENVISQINQYFEQRRYRIILNDRQHLTDYEKDPFSSFPLNGIKEKICFLNACAERLNKNT
jgi:hypothetical protein